MKVKYDLVVTKEEFPIYCKNYISLFDKNQINLFQRDGICFINSNFLILRIFSIDSLNLYDYLSHAGRCHSINISYSASKIVNNNLFELYRHSLANLYYITE